MLIAKTLLLGLRLGRVVRNLERSLAHNLCDATAADTLRADEHRLMAAVCGRDVNPLQVRLKRASADAGHLGTDAAQILLLTTRGDPIADLRTLATHTTLPSHRSPRLANSGFCLPID